VKLPYDLIVFDLETNGEDIPDVRITEIGAVRLSKDLEVLDTYQQLVGGCTISQRIVELTGITDAMIEDEPEFTTVGRQFVEWVKKSKNYLLSAWGAHYDISVLRSEYRRIEMSYPFLGRSLCAKSAAHWHFWMSGIKSKTCGIERALRRLGLEFDGSAHRALDDARNAVRVLRKIAGKE
jgi:DNA polymerase-3 subunit alpha (Gram-positive type)